MKYEKIAEAEFIDRPNRFIAHVKIRGQEGTETVHVKNTGRCRELLIPGAAVVLEDCIGHPGRKTRYDLIAVKKEGLGWVNIDSQAPNRAVGEWLAEQDYDLVRPEYTCGNSRVDFYMERGEERFLLEVKGCTLEIGGRGYFPDAPTERGAKHLRELREARLAGWKTGLAFVIQMEGITKVWPNEAMDPVFAKALREAEEAGVRVLFLTCSVLPDELRITGGSGL